MGTVDYREYQLGRSQRLRFEGVGFLCVGAFVYLFYHSLLLAFAAGFLIRLGQPLYERHLILKRQETLNLQFRDLLDCLSASVTAGRQMSEALIEAYDQLRLMYPPDALILTELAFMRRSILENHESDRDLLADLALRSGSEDIRSFVQVYLTCRSTGGDLARIIGHTARILTEKMKIQEEIRVLTSQKKLEGRLISLMPPVMLLALNLLSPSYIDVLYTTAAGRILMTLCLGAVTAGFWLMEKFSEVQV